MWPTRICVVHEYNAPACTENVFVLSRIITYDDFEVMTDDDLIALVLDGVLQPQVVWKVGDVQVACGHLGLSTATIRLIDDCGEEHIACAVGTGPVDAAYKAVDLIVKA
ncbi:hypothetical protein LguiB_014924 [Lonicera macranthoides]